MSETQGRRSWKVVQFVDDSELEQVLNTLESGGWKVARMYRNTPSKVSGRESTTIVAKRWNTITPKSHAATKNGKH